MASSGLKGPYPLTAQSIDQIVTHVSPGAYALGDSRNGIFHISRVGRSDNDVAHRLHDYVGQYRQFKFDYMPSAKAAFEKECRLYHDFDPPDNQIHPDRPKGTLWKCPRCHIFG